MDELDLYRGDTVTLKGRRKKETVRALHVMAAAATKRRNVDFGTVKSSIPAWPYPDQTPDQTPDPGGRKGSRYGRNTIRGARTSKELRVIRPPSASYGPGDRGGAQTTRGRLWRGRERREAIDPN